LLPKAWHVFAEPQFDPGALKALAGEADIEIGILDAIGSGLEPGPSLYASLLRRNAEAMAECLLRRS
jgi:zinc transport system substrate-binding protein